MKNALLLITASLFVTTGAQALTLQSAPSAVSVARVSELHKLVSKPGIQVNVVIEDLGGSTDLSPTRKAYLTLYVKGEMASAEATFDLGSALEFKSVRRVSGGIYEVAKQVYDGQIREITMRIDARRAVTEIQHVSCNDFDCPASTQFRSTVEIEETDSSNCQR